jgi:hypothetical protein
VHVPAFRAWVSCVTANQGDQVGRDFNICRIFSYSIGEKENKLVAIFRQICKKIQIKKFWVNTITRLGPIIGYSAEFLDDANVQKIIWSHCCKDTAVPHGTVARFFFVQHTKLRKIYQISTKIYQMSIKDTKLQ